MLATSGCARSDEVPQPEPTPIGIPLGNPASVIIGASGGTLTSEDGLVSLSVPAGALDVTLPLKDDGIDETNWSATGTARLTPTAFLMDGASCVVDEPTQAVDESYFLKVLKDPVLAVRFASLTGWDVTCTSSEGLVFPWLISISGRTGRGFGCITPDDFRIADVTNINATYTSTCSPSGPAETEMMLHRTD